MRERKWLLCVCAVLPPPLFGKMHNQLQMYVKNLSLRIHICTFAPRPVYDGMCLFMACLVNNKYNNNVFGLNSIHFTFCKIYVCMHSRVWARTKGGKYNFWREMDRRKHQKPEMIQQLHIFLSHSAENRSMSTIKL